VDTGIIIGYVAKVQNDENTEKIWIYCKVKKIININSIEVEDVITVKVLY
jgi:hypothetical protein